MHTSHKEWEKNRMKADDAYWQEQMENSSESDKRLGRFLGEK